MTMSMKLARWWRQPARCCGGVALSLLLPALGAAADKEMLPAPKEPPAEVKPLPIKTLNLAECLALAFENQPNLAAARSSLAAAETASHCLEKLHPVPLAPGSRELPTRRKQACLGVTIASAALAQTEYETFYAVTRTYYSAVYAKAQERVARDVVDSLAFYQKTVSDAVKKGESREWTTNTVDKITVYLRMSEAKQVEAAEGVERANAALREAVGLGPYCCLRVADDKLAAPEATISLCDIVRQALERRGEIIQVDTALEVYNLEIDAQGKNCMPVVKTFAAASDIHARTVPSAVMNEEYRPGALAPEMPANLVGSKCCRQERAKDFVGRATAMADKTRNLIVLEAEDAYYKWLEMSRKVAVNQEAAEAGARLAKNTRADFRAEPGKEGKTKIEDILTNEVIAAQARSSHNEALYHYILTLAALERITAGGFLSGLAPLPHGCH
jgi:outer membrane protein TolC